MSHKRFAYRHRRREGYLYVAVLFTSLLVATVVAAALSVSTSKLRRVNDSASRLGAIRLAESELHLQAARMQQSLGWRKSLQNNEFSSWRNLSSGRVRHRYNDVDGSLNDDPFDMVTLTVHAELNGAAIAVSAELTSRDSPTKPLRYNITTLSDLQISDSMHVATELPVQVGDDCNTSNVGYLITPQLEYSDLLTVGVSGDKDKHSVDTEVDDVLSRYLGVGTQINRNSIPQVSGDHVIQNVVLSATNNPYGTADPTGVYWIDGSNKDFIIRNCRIEATLVIRNGDTVQVTGAMVWNSIDPARASLITAKTINLESLQPMLSESSQGTNFNPTHTPHRNGVANATNNDLYPTTLGGVFYSEEDIVMTPMVNDERLHVVGALVATNVRISGRLSLTEVPELLIRPPLGFRDPVPMQFVHGSFRREVTP